MKSNLSYFDIGPVDPGGHLREPGRQLLAGDLQLTAALLNLHQTVKQVTEQLLRRLKV